MQDWLKFYEVITKPLPVATALFLAVSTSFLLGAPNPVLAKLGMTQTIATYRWAVGLGFVISAAWLVVTALIWTGRRFQQKFKTIRGKHQAQRDAEKLVPEMTPREREIIAYLLANNQRMFTNKMDCGYANTLISKGIVVCALRQGQMFSQFEVPFEVPEHIWAVLLKHKNQFPYVPPKQGETRAHPWRVHWSAN